MAFNTMALRHNGTEEIRRRFNRQVAKNAKFKAETDEPQRRGERRGRRREDLTTEDTEERWSGF